MMNKKPKKRHELTMMIYFKKMSKPSSLILLYSNLLLITYKYRPVT